jgi:hypothetical protein
MYLTVPSFSTATLVSLLKGVEATTQTSPEESLIAVERPPIGKNPRNLENGLEKVTTSGVICSVRRGVTQGELCPERMQHQTRDKHLTNNDISHVYRRGRGSRVGTRGRDKSVLAVGRRMGDEFIAHPSCLTLTFH